MRDNANPRPVPPKCRVVPSTCEKTCAKCKLGTQGSRRGKYLEQLAEVLRVDTDSVVLDRDTNARLSGLVGLLLDLLGGSGDDDLASLGRELDGAGKIISEERRASERGVANFERRLTMIWRRPAKMPLATAPPPASEKRTSDIADNVDIAFFKHQSKLDTLRSRTLRAHVQNFLEGASKLDRIVVDLEVVHLNLRVVEDVVHDDEELMGGASDRLDIV